MASRDEITEALGFIPSGDRDVWVRVAMAVKSELGEAGFDVWDAWSRTATNYVERDALDVWKSIDEAGPVTIATLFAEAKANGYRSPHNGHERPKTPEGVWQAGAESGAGNHPYLKLKGIGAHGVRINGKTLLIPVRDLDGKLLSVQSIFQKDGDWHKRFTKDAKLGAGCHVLGNPSAGTLILCEGYATGATLHEVTGHPVIIAFDCGRLATVGKAIRVKHPDANILIAADDDSHLTANPGRHKAEKAAKEIGAAVVSPSFTSGAGGDFNDLARQESPGAVKEQIARSILGPVDQPSPEPPEERPKNDGLYVWAADLDGASFNKTFIVEDFLEADRAYEFFGKWKGGKTLVVADLCYHASLGLTWAERRTERSLVVWVAGESVDDVKRRTAAWRLNRGITDSMPFIIRTKPAFIDNEEFAVRLREEISGLNVDNLPVLVVIDSVSRNLTPGTDENSGQGLGAFANNLLDNLVRPLKCTAICVHHSGHGDGNRSRGWSGLPAALDGSVMIEKTQQDGGPAFVTAKSLLMRGSSGSDQMTFRIDVQELPGHDNFGNVIAEPVLFYSPELEPPAASGQTKTKQPKSMGRPASKAFDALLNLYTQHEKHLKASGQDGDAALVRIVDWKDACGFDYRKQFIRAREELLGMGKIRMEEPYVVLI